MLMSRTCGFNMKTNGERRQFHELTRIAEGGVRSNSCNSCRVGGCSAPVFTLIELLDDGLAGRLWRRDNGVLIPGCRESAMRIYLGLNDISDPDPGRTILFWDHVFKAGHECKVWLDD